ncbi:zona pellucida glycoprotein 3b precursor [Silurus meridionalis]|nr:zona pellucida glycoprotein 3b precursor [Silurus meridionalis]
MNVARDAEAHRDFNSLVEEHVSETEPLKSTRNRAVPLRTVSVTCSASAMEVHVKADLFNLGSPVNPEHLTIGEHCGVTKVLSEEFIIHTALTDCDTHYWLTANTLIYTNVLVYSPVPSVHGVIRQEKTTVPVECVYRRRFGVDSVLVVPTWLPHLSAHSAEHSLHFTLHLMTTDWQAVRGGVYYLGDLINMEVSVFAPALELQVFVQDCVATATSYVNSVPRYKFIQNGCFIDGQQTSSKSHFLPRTRSDKLHLQLHSFIFRQVYSTQIFISCSLKANLQSSSSSRACSYIQGRQQQNNVERRHTQDGSVQMKSEEPVHRTSGSMWKTSKDAATHVLEEHVTGVLKLSRTLQANTSKAGLENELFEEKAVSSVNTEKGISCTPGRVASSSVIQVFELCLIYSVIF